MQTHKCINTCGPYSCVTGKSPGRVCDGMGQTGETRSGVSHRGLLFCKPGCTSGPDPAFSGTQHHPARPVASPCLGVEGSCKLRGVVGEPRDLGEAAGGWGGEADPAGSN